MTDQGQRELITGARELGVPLTDKQVSAMFAYVSELMKWNRKINLTAITGEQDVVIKHLLDSLSYIKGFTPRPGIRLLDMGSGAGLPAIPIKIACPDISITLVESVKKKASFLRHIVRALALSESDVLDMRTEELRDSYETSYDIVTARAFADMASALRCGSRFLKTDGFMVLSRGPEEKIADTEPLTYRVHVEGRIDLTLPHSSYKRAIWVFRKM